MRKEGNQEDISMKVPRSALKNLRLPPDGSSAHTTRGSPAGHAVSGSPSGLALSLASQ